MQDAMCKQDYQMGEAHFTVNMQGYDPNTIEGQLATTDESHYELNCMRFCLAKLDPSRTGNCCGMYPHDNGDRSCWLVSGITTSSFLLNRGAHKAMMIDNDPDH
jgi:hypothetical protein